MPSRRPPLVASFKTEPNTRPDAAPCRYTARLQNRDALLCFEIASLDDICGILTCSALALYTETESKRVEREREREREKKAIVMK